VSRNLGSFVVLVDHCGKIFGVDEGYGVSVWHWIGSRSYWTGTEHNREP